MKIRRSAVSLISTVLLLIVVVDAHALDVIYFTDKANGTIERVEADGSNRQVILTSLVEPEGLEVDVGRSLMFWSDKNAGDRRIMRANLDGTNVTLLRTLSNPTYHVNAIALHTTDEIVFWVEELFGFGTLYFSDYSGGNLVTDTVPGGIVSLRGNVEYDNDAELLYMVAGSILYEAREVRNPSSPSYVYAGISYKLVADFLRDVALDVHSTPKRLFVANDTEISSSPNGGGFFDPVVSAVGTDIQNLEARGDSQKLYFTDATQGNIVSVSYDGLQVNTVLSGLGQPFGLAVIGVTPTASPTPTSTATLTPTPTATPTVTATPSPTATPTTTPTAISTGTAIASPSQTPTPTPTNTATSTTTPPPEVAPTEVPTDTPAPSPTPIPTATPLGAYERSVPGPVVRVRGNTANISISDTFRGNRDYYVMVITTRSEKLTAKMRIRPRGQVGHGTLQNLANGTYRAYTVVETGRGKGRKRSLPTDFSIGTGRTGVRIFNQ